MILNVLWVLVFVYKEIDKNELEDKNIIEDNFIFIGFVGMIDLLCKEVYGVVEVCY